MTPFIGLGTLINAAAIVAGGLGGMLFRNILKERYQETITKVCGVSTVFLGIAGTLSKMFKVNAASGAIEAQGTIMMILSLVLGALIGEAVDLDRRFETFGEWLKRKTGSEKDSQFVNGFVTASLTVCIGAMAIIGAIQDGIYADPSILTAKAVLDFIIVMIMASSMGKGCLFAALPVAVWQGTVTLLAKVISPVLTEAALANIALTGNVLIACVGINLIWPRTIRVANLLPAVLLAALFSAVPYL